MTDRVDAKAVLEAMRNSAFCPEPWVDALTQTLADVERGETMKYIRWVNACLWSGGLLTYIFLAIWEHALPVVTPFASFTWLVGGTAVSLTALIREK